MGGTAAILQSKKDAFLAAFETEGTITHAAEKIGIERKMHYYWMANDPDYPERFAAAERAACHALEREARRRAIEGTDKPVYQGGKLVGHIREYSDTLLIFLLKAADPAKYRDNPNMGQYDVSLTVTQKPDLQGLTTEELTQLRELMQKAGKAAALPAPD